MLTQFQKAQIASSSRFLQLDSEQIFPFLRVLDDFWSFKLNLYRFSSCRLALVYPHTSSLDPLVLTSIFLYRVQPSHCKV